MYVVYSQKDETVKLLCAFSTKWEAKFYMTKQASIECNDAPCEMIVDDDHVEVVEYRESWFGPYKNVKSKFFIESVKLVTGKRRPNYSDVIQELKLKHRSV